MLYGSALDILTHGRAMLFSDQVSILSSWFKGWNECEQTVALFSLLKRVKKRQAKFLARCLEHGLKDCVELIPVEQEANNIAFIDRLMGETDQKHVINILLSHLPLLRPGNDEVKTRYLELLPRVLTFAVERSVCLRESRQLLSYSLIHPAFDNDERSSLTSWMEHLEDRIPDVEAESNPPGEASQDGIQNLEDVNRNRQWKDIPDLSRQYGIPQVNSPSWRVKESKFSPSKDPETPTGLPRNDSESDFQRPDPKPPTEDASHGSEYDFAPWLKSLRLHKYKDLFANMTYDEMMQLTEEKLAKESVTKGARDKILLNVKRLHERFDRLKTLEKELSSGGSLKSALAELKVMIYTPITKFEPPASDEGAAQTANLTPGDRPSTDIQPGDIPAQFSKVMGKACTQLLISKPDKDNINSYMHVLEKCIQHQAFTAQQKKRLISWKSQINKMYRSLPKTQQGASQRNAVGPNYSARRVTNRSLPAFGVRMTSPPPPILQASNQQSLFAEQVGKVGWFGGNFGGSNTGPPPHSMQPPIGVARKTASLDPSLVQRPLYPSNPSLESGKPGVQPGGDADFSQNLDSLCHSVAEQALADDSRISTL